MNELFSCRNCVQNPCQGLNLGKGQGFCLQWGASVQRPERTTCKYLHRKDLPRFLVAEGIAEHAAEYANFSGMVDLVTKNPIQKEFYSERKAWLAHDFNPLLNAVAQYHRPNNESIGLEDAESGKGWKWRFIQAFAGSADALRSLAFVSMIRRYMDNCGSWTSSWRLILSVIEEIDERPVILERMVYARGTGIDLTAVEDDALWEIIFARLSAIQEFGFHLGEDEFRWVTDSLNGALTEFDWAKLSVELRKKKVPWEKIIIRKAEAEGIFFQVPTERS